jgi:co-chaperonin GroES (HSP10)
MKIGRKLIKFEPISLGEVKVGDIEIPHSFVNYRWGRVTHVGETVKHIQVGDEIVYDPKFCERGTLLDETVIAFPSSAKAIRRNGELFAGDGHILIEVPSRWLESKMDSGGIILMRNFQEFNKTKNVNRTAKVVAVGHGVDDIFVGDMAMFHFETLLWDDARILTQGIDLWSVSCLEPSWVYAVQRGEELLAVNDWLLVSPEKIPAKEATANGIITLEDDKLDETNGIVRYGHNHKCNPKIDIGDKIMFHKDDAWLNDFGEEKLYVMRANRPIGKIEA